MCTNKMCEKKKRHIVVAKDSVRKQAARHLQPDDGVDGRAVRADKPGEENQRGKEFVRRDVV